MTTFSRFLPAAAFLGAVGAASLATADQGRMGGFGPGGLGPAAIDFAAIDRDGDDALSRTELQARSAAKLQALDLNGDGSLDHAEIVAAFPQRGGFPHVFSSDPAEAMADRMLTMHGGTTDGRVTIAVLSERQVNMLLTDLDTDQDSALSRAEAETRPNRRAEHGGSDGHKRGPRF